MLFCMFSLKIILLGNSEPNDKHIEKVFFLNLIFVGVRKNLFCRLGRKLRTCPQLLGFFDAFP